jgi:hypothetical protein
LFPAKQRLIGRFIAFKAAHLFSRHGGGTTVTDLPPETLARLKREAREHGICTVPCHELSALLAAAEERDRLRAALEKITDKARNSFRANLPVLRR